MKLKDLYDQYDITDIVWPDGERSSVNKMQSFVSAIEAGHVPDPVTLEDVAELLRGALAVDMDKPSNRKGALPRAMNLNNAGPRNAARDEKIWMRYLMLRGKIFSGGKVLNHTDALYSIADELGNLDLYDMVETVIKRHPK